MPCNCGKNRAARPWKPKAARSAGDEGGTVPTEPQPAGRTISAAERGTELANGARPPRAKQPTA